MKRAASHRERGFTLVELLVVLAIIGMLVAVVGPQYTKYVGSSRSQTAKAQVKNVTAALELYRLDIGGYPTPQQGLDALLAAPPGVAGWNGPYLPQAANLLDPWGQRYHFRVPGGHGEIDVYSLGADKAEGGTGEATDVGNW